MFDLLDGGFLLFVLALAVTAIVIFLIGKLLRKLLHPIRKEKVQVAAFEYQDQNLNAKARKLGSSPIGGNRSALQVSHLAHTMVDDILFTFYLLNRDNKPIRLKIQANAGSNMAKVGDIGYVTHRDGWILEFEKIGNINEK